LAKVPSAAINAMQAVLFFGVISSKQFKRFQLRNTGISDGWGIDELMLGIGKD
jgi:hypothetical protein